MASEKDARCRVGRMEEENRSLKEKLSSVEEEYNMLEEEMSRKDAEIEAVRNKFYKAEQRQRGPDAETLRKMKVIHIAVRPALLVNCKPNVFYLRHFSGVIHLDVGEFFVQI